MDSSNSLTGRRNLLVSAAANMLALIAQLAVAFVLAPMILRHFGRERYGAWSFVESILAYFTLFDLGMAATLVRYVPRCRADNDMGLLNRLISGCLLIYSGAGLLVVALGMGLIAAVLQLTTKIPAELHAEIWSMTVVSVITLGLSLPLSIFPATLDGLGRFSLKAAMRTAFLGLRVVGVLWLINADGTLVHLALVFGITVVGEQLAMGFAVAQLLPDLKPAPWRTNRAALALVRGFSFDSFLAMLAGRIAFKTDAIVIGLCGQLDMIPFFDMPSRLVEYSKNLIRSATTTLTPAISALDAKGGKTAIRELFLTGCRFALYLALPIHLALILFGGSFLELWLGDPEYRLRGQPVLWILTGTLSIGMLQSVAARVLYGVGQIRRFAQLMLLEAGLNLVLSLLLFPVLGINGVALGTMIPNVVMCVWIIVQVCRMLDVADITFVRQSLAMSFVSVGVLGFLWWKLAGVIPPTTRFNFLALIGCGVAFHAIVVTLLEFGRMRIASSPRPKPAIPL